MGTFHKTGSSINCKDRLAVAPREAINRLRKRSQDLYHANYFGYLHLFKMFPLIVSPVSQENKSCVSCSRYNQALLRAMTRPRLRFSAARLRRTDESEIQGITFTPDPRQRVILKYTISQRKKAIEKKVVLFSMTRCPQSGLCVRPVGHFPVWHGIVSINMGYQFCKKNMATLLKH